MTQRKVTTKVYPASRSLALRSHEPSSSGLKMAPWKENSKCPSVSRLAPAGGTVFEVQRGKLLWREWVSGIRTGSLEPWLMSCVLTALLLLTADAMWRSCYDHSYAPPHYDLYPEVAVYHTFSHSNKKTNEHTLLLPAHEQWDIVPKTLLSGDPA